MFPRSSPLECCAGDLTETRSSGSRLRGLKHNIRHRRPKFSPDLYKLFHLRWQKPRNGAMPLRRQLSIRIAFPAPKQKRIFCQFCHWSMDAAAMQPSYTALMRWPPQLHSQRKLCADFHSRTVSIFNPGDYSLRHYVTGLLRGEYTGFQKCSPWPDL